MKILSTFEELDAELARASKAANISDDAFRVVLDNFEFRPPKSFFERLFRKNTDPYSEEYRARQLELYHKIAGMPYDPVSSERSEFDVSSAVKAPFPYSTKSPKTVGNQLIAMGSIIKNIELAPPARILEFGPGWGNLTINLARMGYSVTAVDIEPRFVELIQKRAALLDLPMQVQTGCFGRIPDEAPFDVIIFYECFHHCADHLALLQDLKSMLTDSGVMIFASEPITDAFPVPWGIRLDGISVWSIRKFKWLELGFQESYFMNTLQKYGWVASKSCSDPAIFIAKKQV